MIRLFNVYYPVRTLVLLAVETLIVWMSFVLGTMVRNGQDWQLLLNNELFIEGGFVNLIAFFDCLHDMADPAGAARHARAALKSDGRCMLVEPFAADEVADNLYPVGRLYYGASSLVCAPVPSARNGPALGAQAGERQLREIMVDQVDSRRCAGRPRRRSISSLRPSPEAT